MKNLILPNPTKYEISYRDSKGKETSRKIVVINQAKDAITAYCYSSHGIRSFKKEKIVSITSVE